jgi:hypothetical protein
VITWRLTVMQYNWYDERRIVGVALSACESDERLVNQNDYLALCFYHTCYTAYYCSDMQEACCLLV